jgi:Ca2+-binding EF-hand superfamily protein
MKPRRHFPAAQSLLALALGILCSHARAAELPGVGALVDIVIARFDTNGDSKIDTGEWQAGVAGSFDEIDTDGDGRITVAEIDALGDAIAGEAGATVAALVMKLIKPILLSMDTDGDGTVSREEFNKAANAWFARLDANKDAQLTRDELMDLPLKMLLPGRK